MASAISLQLSPAGQKTEESILEHGKKNIYMCVHPKFLSKRIYVYYYVTACELLALNQLIICGNETEPFNKYRGKY